MIRLLYLSQMRLGHHPDDPKNILKVARTNNPKLDISGMLVHGGDHYLQMLEGPEQPVMRLYATILDDERHRNARILLITPCEQRMFGQWAMASLRGNPLEMHQIQELRAHRLDSVHTREFSSVMRHFVQLLRNGQSQFDPLIEPGASAESA